MNVRVERSRNRILLDSDYPTPGLSEAIPGAYFRKDALWSMPLDLTTCHLLRERFGNRLVIGPGLTAWARAEKAQRKHLESTADAADADIRLLPTVAPRLHAAMASRTYQRAAARFVADAKGMDGRRRSLIGDTVGLGKTAEAIAGVLESGAKGPYLVVCPMGAVLSTWEPEIKRWLGADANVITLPTGKVKREAILDGLAFVSQVQKEDAARGVQSLMDLSTTWVIVHPAIVRTQTWFVCGAPAANRKTADFKTCGFQTKYRVGPVDELDCGHEKDRSTKVVHEHQFPQLFSMEWGAVIADESDQMLIRLTGTPNLQRRGMEMLRDLVREDGCRIAMSGTPFRSKPHQLWSTLNWLDPIRWSGKWRWIQNFWRTGGYSGYEIVKDGFIEERRELLEAELRDVMIRRTREEVRADLPAKLYPTNVGHREDLTPGIYVPMNAKQAKAYADIVKVGEAQIEGGTLMPIGILAEITRMRQFASAEGKLVDGEFTPIAAGGKYDWLLEFLKELGFPEKPSTKILVASQFTKLLKVFAAALDKEFKGKMPYGFITGDESAQRRHDTINTFEDLDSELSILFINTKAGGSAITLDAADITVILDETNVDDEQQQLEGRTDNRNPERRIVPRSYYYLRSFGTIEESIAAANAAAKARGGAILDASAIARLAKGKRL